MTNLVTDNTVKKVKFRESILNVQEGMLKMIADGVVKDKLPDCKLTHYYAPIDENYGCGTYARQMFIPKGTLIVGKIHRHQHLNFIMQGKVSVSTEFGPKYFQAPCIFVSEVGLKRAVIAEEDTLWVTVHLTKHLGEENLDKMEEEVIAPSYKELGLIDSTKELITEN
jgi:quercetin dioxygenase-like cupin family protein